jgi:serine/threonine-protein kinase
MEIEKLGRYELLSELGQGAMGVVYKAIDPLIDRTVAIKTINLNLSKDELADFEERFNREARSAGRLSHPNIVTIYDVGRADHVAYMAMEYLEGRELKDIIASGETLPLDRIVEITAQIADGLAFAHDNGVIHRDIKPANIMVLSNGCVKITDFGIAKMSSGSRTQVGIVLGSPKYMSPEQVVGKPVDGRSDIFSLGTVLYELLAGRPAFGGGENTLATIMYRILNETPVLPGKINPTVPGSLDYIVSKALAKEPENRYQSAREMACDLRNYQDLTFTLPPRSAATNGNKTLVTNAGKKDAENEGDATVVLDTRQLQVTPSSGKGKRTKLAGIVVMIFLVAAAAFFFNPGRQPAATAPENKEPQPTAAETSKAQPLDKAKPKALTPALATITFAVLPWGEVFVDGESQGASPPLKDVKLSPGKHQIEIRNTDFPPYRETVELKPGSGTKIRHKFK